MRLIPAVLSSFLLTATVAVAQTGFITKTYPAANDTRLRVADFNHDGRPDLLSFGTVQGAGSSVPSTGNIYLNDGSGGFRPAVALPTNPTIGSIGDAKIADMNGDGAPDIVACTGQYNSSTNVVDNFLVIYLNNGSGSFTIGQTTPLAGCSSLVVGDVNLDGHQDVVVASGTQDRTSPFAVHNTFQTFFGDGSGKVGSPVTTSNVNLDIPSTQIGGDVNCSVIDITGGNFFVDNQFSLIVNSSCNPGFSTPQQFGTTFLAHGDGTGHFTFTQSNAPVGYLQDGQTVDLNKDGRPDGIFISTGANSHTGNGADNTSLYTAINNGSGNLTYSRMFDTSGESGLTAGDLNGDGIPDLAAAYDSSDSQYAQTFGPGTISIYSGSANGAFADTQDFNVGGIYTQLGDLVSADFNGDGKTDLATIAFDQNTKSAMLYVYTNTLGSSSNACAVPTKTNTNIICTPARGATVSSPFNLTAASNVPGLTLNRVYVDNYKLYETTSQTVNTSITLAGGTHNLVLVSYNNTGQAFTYSTSFTVGSGGPGGCLPSSSGVAICSPSSGSTDNSPVTLTAGAKAQSGFISAIRAYIDNVAVLTVNNPQRTSDFQVSQAINVAPGSHTLVVLGYQTTGGQVSRSETFTVSGSTPCYPSGAGAKICSPSQNASVTSPFSVVAGATAGSGYITAIRVYLDNVAQKLINNPQQSKSFAINTSQTAAAGGHNLVIVGYQSTGGSVSSNDHITVK